MDYGGRGWFAGVRAEESVEALLRRLESAVRESIRYNIQISEIKGSDSSGATWSPAGHAVRVAQRQGQRGVRQPWIKATMMLLLLLCVCQSSGNEVAKTDLDSVRTSQYVTVRDGTRLAIDIYRPAIEGKALDEPLPVLLEATIDNRRQPLSQPFVAAMLKQHYVVVLLEIRGRGASFGATTPMRLETAADDWDLYDVIEWLARQPWSDGKVGMTGCSNRGMLQFRAAAVMPPHLRAIAPTSAPVDWAMMGTINGVTTHFFGDGYEPTWTGTPVDEDLDGTLAYAASLEHTRRGTLPLNRPFRDLPISLPDAQALSSNWWNELPNFTLSKIPVFQYGGWRDFFPEQTLALHRSLARLGVPQKLIIGPWYHCEWYQSDLTDAAAETVKWYDYWLKGIDNGVMRGPAIRYYVVGAPAGQEWKSLDRWPSPKEHKKTYILGDQGRLSLNAPSPSGGADHYAVDYHTTTGKLATRWNRDTLTVAFDPKGAAQHPGLMPIPTSTLDANSLTYTSEPLKEDAELTGFPVINVWISSTVKDQDFFVYLEEVNTEGRSSLLTEGAMRASGRVIRPAPFDNEALPWHANYKADQKELEVNVPTKLEWALFPFSNYVRKGHRLRVTLNSFDQDGWISPEASPAPTVTIFHDAQHPSSITLPFISK